MFRDYKDYISDKVITLSEKEFHKRNFKVILIKVGFGLLGSKE